MILKDNRDLVVHTYQVISAVERAFSDIQDAETGQRGFIITGDQKYLDPYEHALQTSPESLLRIRQLIVDRPDQLGRLDNLEAALRSKMDEFQGSLRVLSEWTTRRRRAEKASDQQLQKVPSGGRSLD
jgi:CHASE3 domain sensor protein